MITTEEQKFIDYWDKNRDKHKRVFYQMAVGLPIGLVFGLPIILALIFSNWYHSLPFVSSSELVTIMIAVLGIAVFFALFRMRHRWEMNEQFYKELKFKENSEES